VVLLPSLVFSAKVEGTRVLEVRWQHNSFITSFTRKLDTKIPGIERNERKVEVLRGQMFGGKGVEAVDGISESARVSDMFPCKSCQARCRLLVTDSALEQNIYLKPFAVYSLCAKRLALTAQRCDGSVNWLHEGAFAVELYRDVVS